MDYYDIVTRYYKAGYYDNEDVKVFVTRGKISTEQYQEITGEPL